VYIFESPVFINKSYYCCDKCFHIDEIIRSSNKTLNKSQTISYLYALISGEEYRFYSIDLSNIDKNIDMNMKIFYNKSYNLKKHKKGGQSSVRFGRIADEVRDNYIKEIYENYNKFLNSMENRNNIGKIIIAGPSELKIDFSKRISRDYKIYNTSELNDQSIYNVIELSKNDFNIDINIKNNNLLDEIKKNMNNNTILYGINEIIKIIENEQESFIKKIIVSNDEFDNIILSNLKTKLEDKFIIVNNNLLNDNFSTKIIALTWSNVDYINNNDLIN
jgi:peptide subunit release factor 1 (eRF1)